MYLSGFLFLIFMLIIYAVVFYLINKYANDNYTVNSYLNVFLMGLISSIIDLLTFLFENQIFNIFLGTSYLLLGIMFINIVMKRKRKILTKEFLIIVMVSFAVNIILFYVSGVFGMKAYRLINVVTITLISGATLYLAYYFIRLFSDSSFKIFSLIEIETYLVLSIMCLLEVINQLSIEHFSNRLIEQRYVYASLTFIIFQLGIVWITKHALQIMNILNRERYTDSLTELFNRRYFFGELDKRKKSILAIVIIDIDYFKRINDEWGHTFGDKVLKGVATILRRFQQSDVLAARIGGEEFALAVFTKELDVSDYIEGIRKEIEETSFDDIKLTISSGIAFRDNEDISIELLYHQADVSLYSAKSNGRNQVRIFSEES